MNFTRSMAEWHAWRLKRGAQRLSFTQHVLGHHSKRGNKELQTWHLHGRRSAQGTLPIAAPRRSAANPQLCGQHMLGCAYLHTHTEVSASPAATHGPLAPSHRMACTRIGLLLKKKKLSTSQRLASCTLPGSAACAACQPRSADLLRESAAFFIQDNAWQALFVPWQISGTASASAPVPRQLIRATAPLSCTATAVRLLPSVHCWTKTAAHQACTVRNECVASSGAPRQRSRQQRARRRRTTHACTNECMHAPSPQAASQPRWAPRPC
jgi:hypothetical protein